ncbi:hypothetical protein [Nocardioides sp. InS609-2]|uniref:hypothetical protein n=1 Tax=Nocardioides sp. InS609-2 TaxID=2760705 RepID=UPI0020C0B737|nr:hypothetical protein [Nocardioides sp. InS609-2]
MAGPLPRLYRIVIVVAMLLICSAAGAWLGASPSLPFLIGTGMLGGALVGVVASYALLHQPRH